MKKHLLTMVALMATTVGFAQELSTVRELSKSKTVTEFSVAQRHELQDVKEGKMMKKAPKKAFSDGVLYARPEGSYWISGTSTDGTEFEYLIVPPFTDQKFINLTTNKEESTWTLGTSDMSSYTDEENNLIFNFSKPSPGYVIACPAVNFNNISYQAAQWVYPMDSVAMTLHPFNYLKGKRYYGYSDGSSAFMSGADSFDFDGDGNAEEFYPLGFRQYFDKPATALRLNEVSMWITTSNKEFDGKDIYLVFNKVVRDEKNRRTLGEVIDTMHCSNIELLDEVIGTTNVYPGDITFAKMTEDEFGTPTNEPIVLTDEFAITIMGTNKKDIDIRFYYTDQGGSEEEFETWATPTYIVPCDEKGKQLGENPNGLSYWNETASGQKYCYSVVFMFDAEMEGMEVVTTNDLNQQIAPVEGGETESAYKVDGKGAAAYVYTNYPFFEDEEATGNYELEGVPTWASAKIDPTAYEYQIGTDNEIRGLHLIWFEAEPLPAGETGRLATVTVKSAFGISAETPIYILQGDAQAPTGVKAIKFDAKGKFVGTYNMNGQRVNENAKGIVIRDGKKFFNK
ncbi:MAG: hypothetical protein J6I52_00220 [Prevotella sp.]|nr:hypothetical protein [Prevotella sp.]